MRCLVSTTINPSLNVIVILWHITFMLECRSLHSLQIIANIMSLFSALDIVHAWRCVTLFSQHAFKIETVTTRFALFFEAGYWLG